MSFQKKTTSNGAFFVYEEFAEIRGDAPVLREDMVRLGGNSRPADIRYRGMFNHWWTVLTIGFNPRVIAPEQIVNIFTYGGFSNGVGEWRREKGGSFGRFHCETV